MQPECTLLRPGEVDRLLRYTPGQSEELAKKGMIPHIELPCGSIRFHRDVIDRIIRGARREAVPHAN